MRRNFRISNRKKNLLIYLCKNNILYICLSILMILSIILSFIFLDNNIIKFLLIVIVEINWICLSIRDTDKEILKRNKLKSIILSSKSVLLYPLILLSIFTSSGLYSVASYLLNFEDNAEIWLISFCVLIVMLITLTYISFVLAKSISKRYKKRIE